ncbi:zf-HC2 domain-containing protein [Streptomyces sp. NPDC048566]|uniref:zf-HC2 domain-containing protein n=1 Tax=Streptomyces sp. NPDC048566 TaxID=3365569 RepID=UPI00371625D7
MSAEADRPGPDGHGDGPEDDGAGHQGRDARTGSAGHREHPGEPDGSRSPGEDGGHPHPQEHPENPQHVEHPEHPQAGIPLPRSSVEDTGLPLPRPALSPEPDPFPEPAAQPGTAGAPAPLALEHGVLKSLLGAWALAACSAEETAAVEEHLGACGACADEAMRLRGAVALLHPAESLDLDPALRTRVLTGCLDRRPPRIPVPSWADAYDAETARLDALLQDIGGAEWHAPVRLRWFDGRAPADRRTTVAGVIAHLLSVDGLVAVALGLDDPLGETDTPDRTPQGRTETYWRSSHFPPTRSVRGPWRAQSHAIVRTASFVDDGTVRADGTDTVGLTVPYGDFALPLGDAMLDRAFECWVHAWDIADAVDYPYEPPAPRHLHRMIDLAARMLPGSLAERRRVGLSSPAARHLVAAGTGGRSLRLEIEGSGGGDWLIPLDSPDAVGSAEHEVAHVALDGVEFCRLAAGHVSPEEAAAGQDGDRAAIRDVLFAAASLSRM